MATDLDYMLADYASLLKKRGVSAVIDGVPVKVFKPPVVMTPSEFSRAIFLRQQINHLVGDLEQKVTGQVISVDGTRWEVVSHSINAVSGVLIMQRGMS